MRFLAWNIQSGGGQRIPLILQNLENAAPDFIALTEVTYTNLAKLQRSLFDLGFQHIETTCTTGRANSVLIASKFPLDLQRGGIKHDSERWLSVSIKGLDVNVLCVHVPDATTSRFDENGYGISGKKRKELFWDEVIGYAKQHRDTKTILLGDFNTGLKEDAQGAPFVLSDYLRVLRLEKYTDTWRHLNPKKREYTWYSQRTNKTLGTREDYNGFRLDYVFVSPPLRNHIASVEHIHSVRSEKLSDHSAICADIEVNG